MISRIANLIYFKQYSLKYNYQEKKRYKNIRKEQINYLEKKCIFPIYL